MIIQELLTLLETTADSKPDYGDQLPIVKLIKKETGVKVYFDHTDLVDEKSSATILSDAFSKKTIQQLIDAVAKFKTKKSVVKEADEQDYSASVDNVFRRLVRAAKTPDNYDDGDEKSLRSDIEGKLKKGWTESEIVGHLKWTEYFDTETDEDTALNHLKRTGDAVKERLKGEK